MYSFEELKDYCESLKKIHDMELGAKNKLEETKKNEIDRLAKYEKDAEVYEKRKLLIKEACHEARKQSKDLFCSLATHGLKHIFGSNLSVDIELGEKGEDATADFWVKSIYDDYEIIAEPTEGEGGGVADVVALASFFNLSNLKRNENVAPYVLDEPTKYVSVGHAEDVSKFIKEVSALTGRQVIMVTHDIFSKHVADKSYLLALDDKGITRAEDVTKQKSDEKDGDDV